MLEEPLSYAMLSDPGRVRSRNEDACAADVDPDGEHGLFVVCDGVGGAAGGEIASQLAAKTFLARVVEARGAKEGPEASLRAGIEAANRAVHGQSQERPELYGMATTMVALVFNPDGNGENPDGNGENQDGNGEEPDGTGESAGTVWLANVGDSRCYRLREGGLEQMTHDHSLVGEQVRSGLMTREQAEVSPIRNVITRAVGSESDVQPDVQSMAARHGDVFLLASDGLTRELSDEDVAEVLVAGTGSELESVCAELVRRANEKGGGDNITCLLVRIR